MTEDVKGLGIAVCRSHVSITASLELFQGTLLW